MRAKSILVIGGLGLVGLAAVGLIAGVSSPSEEVTIAAPTAAARPVTVAHVDVPPPSVVSRTVSAPSVPAVPEVAPAQRDQQVVARIDDQLAQRLRSERVDPGWARNTESAIMNTLAGPQFAGIRLDAVACAATLCRITLTADEQVDDVSGVVEDLTSQKPFRHGGFVRFTATRALTMYVARQGHPLPSPPQT